MEKTNTLWEKYNIFKHWPPLVRAYRQNASGMEVSPSQKRYLKWGSLIPVILFSIGWFIYYLPYFKHQADIGFFSYTGNFVSPFFDGTSAPQLSEFLWRFVSQFYFNTPLIIAVVAFLVIGFCITSWKTAGPYTPFLLLLFFLLFPSADPVQAGTAISLWLDMGALSVFFLLFRHAARHPRAWTPLVFLHLYTALVTALLYYATGHWALLFSIAVVFSHLVGIPMALGDKKQGLWKIRLWNFIVSFILTTTIGICLWGTLGDSAFKAPWYVWSALAVFGLACIPGILLQAYNNRKIFLHEWNRRRGIHDGKPALAPSHHILLTLVAVGFNCLILFAFAANPLDKALVRVQHAVSRNDYEAGLAACLKFYGLETQADTLGQRQEQAGRSAKKRYATPSGQRKLVTLALYQDLCLAGQGLLSEASEEELSRQFARLDSLRIPALEYACIKMHEIEGEPGQVVDGVLEQAQDFDLQNRHMRPLVEAGMAEHRVDLLEVALYYARKSFYSRDLYLEYKESVPNIHKGKLTDSLL